MTNVKPATDEYVTACRTTIEKQGDCSCPRYGECGSHNCEEVLSLIARIDADREEPRALRQAIGMLTTLHPTMVMDPLNPVGMALQVHAHVTQEIAALKAEVETVRGCLHELAATARGEAPSLLNEDSGGDAFLSMRIDAALGIGRAR